MTEVLKMLEPQLAALKGELSAVLEQRADAATADVRKSLEAKIDELAKRVEATEKSKDIVARQTLPGLEYAKKGEEGKFSLFRAMNLCADLQRNATAWDRKEYGVEVEAMREIERRGGYHPTTGRAMNTGTSAAGGVFVPHQVLYDAIIPALQETAIIYTAGAQRLDGLVGELSMIVDNGGTTAYYIDTPSEEIATETASTFSTIKASPHTMSANTRLTRDMRRQSAVSMEQFVRNEIVMQFALREDLSAFRGTGSNAEPRGIANVSGLTTATSFSGVTYTGGSQTLSDKLRDMMYAPRLAKYMNPAARWAWVADPAVGLKIAKAKDADGRALFVENNVGRLTSLMQTPFVESTLVDTANDSDAFLLYGDFTQVYMCHWGTLELEVGTQSTDLTKGAITIVGFMDHDVLVRQPKAFNLASSFTQ